MLSRFAVENFLCFGERAVLDLSSEILSPSPIALLCGENGSGKSALQAALACVRNLVLAGTRPGQALPITPNLLHPAGPSRFELTISQDNALWNYGFAATTQKIVEEWLTHDTGNGPQTLFSRAGEPLAIELGDGFPEGRKKLELVAYGTRPEQLFLNEALRRGVASLAPIGIWLRDRLQLVLAETKVVGLASRAAREPAFAVFLSKLLTESGSDVTQIDVRREPIEPDTFESEDEQRELVTALTSFPDAFAETPDGELIAELDGRVVDLFRVRLVCTVTSPNGRHAELPVSALSDGQKRLLHLAPLLHTRVAGPIYFVDDLDRSVTTPLLRKLLAQFHDRAEAGQLIATLHDPAPLKSATPVQRIHQLEPAATGVTIRTE